MPKAAAKKSPLKPFEIDQLCEVILIHENTIEVAECAREKAVNDLLPFVKREGQPQGEKSKLLIGLLYEALRTDADSTKVIAVKAEAARMLMAHAGLLKEFKQLFRKESRFVLQPGFAKKLLQVQQRIASAAIDAKLADKCRRALTAAVCVTQQDPKLKVRVLKAKKKAAPAKAKKASAA